MSWYREAKGIKSKPNALPSRASPNIPKGARIISGERLIPKRKKAGMRRRHCRKRSKKTWDNPLKEKARGEHLIFTKTELPDEKPCMTPVKDLAKIPQSIVPTIT